MTELTGAYDYDELGRNTYFIICFDSIPSKIEFETELTSDRANMEAVFDLLDLDEFEIVYKNWKTEDKKNSDTKENYPCEYLLKSKSKKMLIWISLKDSELSIEQLYDVSDSTLEEWVITLYENFRSKFGRISNAILRVLAKDMHGSFFSKKVSTKSLEIDVDKFYNDDFRDVHKIICDSISQNQSGLILLHGTPGTGKTSYIKSLITCYESKTFIFVQNEFINELLSPDFTSFLLKQKNSILIIEDAEKVIMSREKVKENSVVSTILQLTDGLFSDFLNVKIICTFNTETEMIDKALLRKGRMIAYYKFSSLSIQKTNELMVSLEHEPPSIEMTLTDIFNYKEREFVTDDGLNKIGF